MNANEIKETSRRLAGCGPSLGDYTDAQAELWIRVEKLCLEVDRQARTEKRDCPNCESRNTRKIQVCNDCKCQFVEVVLSEKPKETL